MAETSYASNSLETESEMLPQDPPPRIMRILAVWLLGLFVVALLATVFVKLPETEHANFTLIPKEGADPIQSPRLATISKVAVTEGQPVKAGEELFSLRSEEIRGWDTQLRTLTEDLRTHEMTLSKMDEAYAAEMDIKTAQVAQAESELHFREKAANSNSDLLKRSEELSKKGGVATVDLIRLRVETAGAEKDLAVAQRTMEQVRLERQQLQNEHTRKRAEEAGEVEKLKVKLNAIKADMENSQQNVLTIRAPYDGVVISLAQRSVGNVVQGGQELCQIARLDSTPLARLALNESGMAKLNISQPVRFFFDAFPYQHYGALSGKLEWVSPSAVTSSDGQRFVAIASFDDTPNRRRLAIRPGMKGEARIRVGSHRLGAYLFEPLQHLGDRM